MKLWFDPFPISYELPGPSSFHQAIYRFKFKYHKNEKDNRLFSYRYGCGYRLCFLCYHRFLAQRLQNEPGLRWISLVSIPLFPQKYL